MTEETPEERRHRELVRAIRSVANSIGWFTFVFWVMTFWSTCMLDG